MPQSGVEKHDGLGTSKLLYQRSTMPIAICLAGLQFSAKEECSVIAKAHGVPVYKVGDWVRSLLLDSNTILNFIEINKLSEKILKEDPYRPFREILDDIFSHEMVVIDSVKNYQQVNFLRQQGLEVKIVSLHCPKPIRFKRLSMRERMGDPKNITDFDRRDSMELNSGLKDLLLNSDYKIFSKSQQKAANRFLFLLKYMSK